VKAGFDRTLLVELLQQSTLAERRIGSAGILGSSATDLRKSIDGLSALVSAVFELDLVFPTVVSSFVINKRQTENLRWDTNGFWLISEARTRALQWPRPSWALLYASVAAAAVVAGWIEH